MLNPPSEPERGGILPSRVSLDGGPPRELLENVVSAGWGPQGQELAIVRQVGGDTRRLEYPVGRVLREASRVGSLRSAPRRAARRTRGSGRAAERRDGRRGLRGRRGPRRTRAHPLGAMEEPRGARRVSGRPRDLVFRGRRIGRREAWHSTLWTGRDARASCSAALGTWTSRTCGRTATFCPPTPVPTGAPAGDCGATQRERDLSLASWSVSPGLLPDGGAAGLLTRDEATGTPGAWLWRAGQAVPVRLADCGLYALSSDGRRVLCGEGEVGRPREFRIVPTGPGEATALPRGPIDRYQWGFFCPDSRRVVFTAQEKGRPRRLFVQDPTGGPPRPLTPEGVAHEMPRMRGGNLVLSRNADDAGDPWRLYPLDGGEPELMPWLHPRRLPRRLERGRETLPPAREPGLPAQGDAA